MVQLITLDLSFYSMRKAEDSHVCVEPDGCSTRPHIRILYPAIGSQLQMSECRIRYIVENAPTGAFSRVFIDGTEFQFFLNGKKNAPFVSAHFDEAFTVSPGDWDIQVD